MWDTILSKVTTIKKMIETLITELTFNSAIDVVRFPCIIGTMIPIPPRIRYNTPNIRVLFLIPLKNLKLLRKIFPFLTSSFLLFTFYFLLFSFTLPPKIYNYNF